MNTIGQSINEYKLIIDLSEPLRNKIMRVKTDLNHRLGRGAAARPYLLLASFRQHSMLEEKLVNRLTNTARAFYPFKLELKDYGIHPYYSVFINVSSNFSVNNLVTKIRNGLQSFVKSNDLWLSTEPLVTMAQKLSSVEFDIAQHILAHKQFTGRCLAKEMLLLKRRAGTKNWQVAKHLQFENLPVETTQAVLF